jgi:hypothetical protein
MITQFNPTLDEDYEQDILYDDGQSDEEQELGKF